MLTIGPYRFSEQDAKRTVENFPDLWTQFKIGRDAACLNDLEPSFTAQPDVDLARAWQALTTAGPALRAAGQLPSMRQGTVAQLSTSTGGVPKRAVDTVTIDFGGAVGDVQATRQHHGRPWQALCIWSTEVIDQFIADGHPIAAGLAGENVTIAGLHWPDVRPGVKLRLGTTTCEVLAFAVPCRKNAAWFLGGNFDLMHHRHGPVSRVYARIIDPGGIAVGDAAILEP